MGGTFVGFDPANNTADGEKTNYVKFWLAHSGPAFYLPLALMRFSFYLCFHE